MMFCNFSPDCYFIYDNRKTKFRECFCVKVGCLLMIFLESSVSTSKGLEKNTKTGNNLSDLDFSAFCSCFIMHL